MQKNTRRGEKEKNGYLKFKNQRDFLQFFFAISALNQQDSEKQEPKSWVGCSFFGA